MKLDEDDDEGEGFHAACPHDEERKAVISVNHGFHLRPPPPPHELETFLTSEDTLFQTIHMGSAEVDVSQWKLVIDGMVERPFSLTFERLQRLTSKTITAFVECYGSPLKPPIVALRRIGNVTWTGVPLSTLLHKAGIQPGARYVWSDGLDSGSFGGVDADRYQKECPIEKALDANTLVAYAMNGKPLGRNRGGPVRLVVPGWFGTNSTKWLCRLSVQDRRAESHFTTTFYNERFPPDDPTCASRPVWEVQTNSVIVSPSPGTRVKGPEVKIEGWAWSHEAVRRVALSVDEGVSWKDAEVGDRTDFSWQRFGICLELKPGEYTLLAKATSEDGRTQPLGEGRNHVHRVRLHVF